MMTFSYCCKAKDCPQTAVLKMTGGVNTVGSATCPTHGPMKRHYAAREFDVFLARASERYREALDRLADL